MITIMLAGILFRLFGAIQPEVAGRQGGQDSLTVQRQHYATAILDSLKDRGAMPADSIFQNLQVFRSTQRVQVNHLMGIMKYWGEALGVNCTYCHNPANWASDELRTKRIARDMFAMRVTINNQILANIKDLASKPARVNCGTCHDGGVLPSK
jgi:hypothetical protein